MSKSVNRSQDTEANPVEKPFKETEEYELLKNQFKLLSADFYKTIKAINKIPIDQFEEKILGMIPSLMESRPLVNKHLQEYQEGVYLKPREGSEKIWYSLYKRGLDILKAGMQEGIEFEKPEDFFEYLLSQAGDKLLSEASESSEAEREKSKTRAWVLSYPPGKNKFVLDLHFLFEESKAIFKIYDDDYEMHEDGEGALEYDYDDIIEGVDPEDLMCHFMHSILMLMKTSAMMVDEGELKQKVLINGFIKSLEDDVSGLADKHKRDFIDTIGDIADRVGFGKFMGKDRLKQLTAGLGNITPDNLDQFAQEIGQSGFLNMEEMVDEDGNINPQYLINKIGETQQKLGEMELPDEAKERWAQNK